MVKSVVGEESQLSILEDRLAQSQIPAQVGLVIGKLSSALDRGFIFDLIPTPLNDAGEPACSVLRVSKEEKKKGSKSKPQAVDSSSLEIDKDWIAEHARQVSRMLMGGMNVVGIYVWVSDIAFKNSTITLCQTVKAVADAAPLLDADLDERILIHICYSPRRWTCRNCTLASNITSNNLRPCDFKMGKILNSLQTFRCMYNFDLRLPVYKSSSNAKMFDVLRNGICVHAEDLKGAKSVIDGKLITHDEPFTSDGTHEVEFFLPFVKDSSNEARIRKEVAGVVSFSGSMCSFAYVNSKEPISQAVADIKEDIIQSLQSRLDILWDEADNETSQPDAEVSATSEGVPTETPVSQLPLHLLRKSLNLSFPRRVFVPWLAGTLVSDYLQPSEPLETLKDHCIELLSMDAAFDNSSILEPEKEALAVTARSFWDVAAPIKKTPSSSSPKSATGKSRRNNSENSINLGNNTSLIVAALFLVLSVIVWVILVRMRGL